MDSATFISKAKELGFVFSKYDNNYHQPCIEKFEKSVNNFFMKNLTGEDRSDVFRLLSIFSCDVEFFNIFDLLNEASQLTGFYYGDLSSLSFKRIEQGEWEIKLELFEQKNSKGDLKSFNIKVDQDYSSNILIFLNQIIQKAKYFVTAREENLEFFQLPNLAGQDINLVLLPHENYQKSIDVGLIPSDLAVEYITREF
jgi:hypothetical protein